MAKRVKEVFSNSREVAHIWASGEYFTGRNSQGNIYFKNKTIYSYRDSFPLAKMMNDDVVLLTTRTYSNTTAKHHRDVRIAIPRSSKIINCTNVDVFIPQKIDGKWINCYKHDQNIKCYLAECEEWATKAVSAKSKRNYYLTEAKRCISSIKEYAEYFKLTTVKCPILKELKKTKYIDLEKLVLDVTKIKVKEKAELKERQEALKQKSIENLEEWRNGLIYTVRYDNIFCKGDTVRLRVIYKDSVPDRIETTKGVKMGIETAAHLYKVLKTKTKETTQISGIPTSVGNRTISLRNKKGITSGCHFIEYKEIELIANQLNWK